MQPTPPRWGAARWIVFAAIWIASAIAAGWLFVHYTGGVGEAWAIARQVSAPRWLAALALTIGFYALDWVRYAALFRLLGRPFPFRLGMRLVAISYFVSSLTPSAELHLPVLVLLLVERGYPVAEATAATVTKSIYMVLWVIVFGLAGLHLAGAGRVPAVIDDHLLLWLAAPAVIVALLVAVVVAPGPIHRACRRRLARPELGRWQRRLFIALDKLPSTFATIGRSTAGGHLVAHLGCIAFVGVYCVLGHVFAHGVGLEPTARESYASSSVGLMVSYLAPVPGSVGVTEGAISHLLDPAISAPAMTSAILLRTCTWYAAAVIGAFLLAHELQRIGWGRFLRWLREEPARG